MKNFGWAAVCLGLALFSGSASAQQAAAPASGPVANPVTTMIKSQLPRFQKNMTGAAELMPPDKYSFKATPESTSFGHMVFHSATANFHLCAAITGATAPDSSMLIRIIFLVLTPARLARCALSLCCSWMPE